MLETIEQKAQSFKESTAEESKGTRSECMTDALIRLVKQQYQAIAKQNAMSGVPGRPN